MFTKAVPAMVLIAGLLVVAMLKDIDGILLTTGISLIAGLGGFFAGKKSKS